MVMSISVLIKLGGLVGQSSSLWSDVNQNFKWLFRVDHKFLFSLFFFFPFNRVIWCNDVIGIIKNRYNYLTKKKKLHLLTERPEVPL